MILKLARDGGTRYQWLDKIDEVEDFGAIWDRAQDSEQFSGRIAYVRTFGELIEAVNSVWGDQREFDHEVWPAMPGEIPEATRECSDVPSAARHITTVKCRRGKEQILVILVDEAYLLSDNGDTIDRLR